MTTTMAMTRQTSLMPQVCRRLELRSLRRPIGSALSVDRELAFGERFAVGSHVAISLPVDGQLVVAHDDLDVGCAAEGRFGEDCKYLLVELDQQFVRTGGDEGQPV